MNQKAVEVKKEPYIRCGRCENSNWQDSTFWGCPRGSCEAEECGSITTTRDLIRTK